MALRARISAALGVAAAIAAAALPGSAAAGPPERVSESGMFVDEFLTELCGAEITISYSFRETIVYFEEGSIYPHQHLANYRATIAGPGGSLIEREAWRDYDTGDSATVTGLPFRIMSPGGGVLIRDAGYILFTEDGIAVVHGPHPLASSDDPLDLFRPLCAYLV